MIAFDPTTKKIWFGKNGTWANSGNPSTATNPTITYSGTGTAPFYFGIGDESAGGLLANFGNPSYTGGSYTDGAGYGNFSYAVPSGYYALCSANLAKYG